MVCNSFQNGLNLTGAKVISLHFYCSPKAFQQGKVLLNLLSTSKRVLVIKTLGSFCSIFLTTFSTYYENDALLKI